MPDKQWKRTERRIAHQFGAERTGPGRPNDPDIRTSWLSIEVKERYLLPEWILRALRDAQRKAKPDQLPIAVLHETGSKDDLVVLSRKDFIDWFGGEQKGGDDNDKAVGA